MTFAMGGTLAPGIPVHHQLPEFTQTHVHRVSDAIQPSHPLLWGASSARGKGHEEGGLTYAKAGSSLRSLLEILEHIPPKPESAYFLLCA